MKALGWAWEWVAGIALLLAPFVLMAVIAALIGLMPGGTGTGQEDGPPQGCYGRSGPNSGC